MPKNSHVLNAMTIDVEEWFCVSNFEKVIGRSEWARLESRVERQVEVILDLLDRHGVTATFFTLGWVARRHPDLVRAIVGKGHELASHGDQHHLAYDMTPDEFRGDLARSIDTLEEISGVKCRGYRAPSFSLRTAMTWAWDALSERGIDYDSSIFPVAHPRYGESGVPRHPFLLKSRRAEIVEIPLSTIPAYPRNLAVAGGGYLRLYPLPVTRWAIERINREGNPAVIYVHPWEFDPDHPRPDVSRLTLLRHRVGIATVPRKLDALLGDLKFGSMSAVVEGLDVTHSLTVG